MKRLLFLALGLASLALGAVGAVLPLLPSVPFLLLAAFCFAKSSRRLHSWFVNTRLYKDNLESYVQGKGMTMAAKLRIVGTVTLLMGIGFLMMGRVPVGRLILVCVWVLHLLYFFLGVRTLRPGEEPPAESAREDA